jgi:TRAP-type C4-dicarboxylate transport system permease small subunit
MRALELAGEILGLVALGALAWFGFALFCPPEAMAGEVGLTHEEVLAYALIAFFFLAPIALIALALVDRLLQRRRGVSIEEPRR